MHRWDCNEKYEFVRAGERLACVNACGITNWYRWEDGEWASTNNIPFIIRIPGNLTREYFRCRSLLYEYCDEHPWCDLLDPDADPSEPPAPLPWPACQDTSDDWRNCGRCGHVCRAPDGVPGRPGRCVKGRCAPASGECFEQGDFDTCAEYCESIGETCTTCGSHVWHSHDTEDEVACAFGRYYHRSGGPPSAKCTDPLPTGARDKTLTCCCKEAK